MNQMLEQFKTTPTYRAMMAEADAEYVAKRQGLVDKLDEASIEFSAALGEFNAEDKKNVERVAKLRNELSAATNAMINSRNAWHRISTKIDARRRNLIGELEQTASNTLRRFATWCDQMANDIRWVAHGKTVVIAYMPGGEEPETRAKRAADIANPLVSLCYEARQWAIDEMRAATPAIEIEVTIESYVERIHPPANEFGVITRAFKIED